MLRGFSPDPPFLCSLSVCKASHQLQAEFNMGLDGKPSAENILCCVFAPIQFDLVDRLSVETEALITRQAYVSGKSSGKKIEIKR
jgi:hypothetical protein